MSKSPKRNPNRPYTEDLLFQIKQQNEQILENQKTIKVTLNMIHLGVNDVKTHVELLDKQNLDWIHSQLKEQGHVD